MSVETGVLERYSAGAESKQADLCCPVDYEAKLLTLLPQEIIDKDYGCGDPSRYVKEGDVVLDLGSGSGKICYMAAQLVGKRGKVIGIDMNDDMLALATRYQPEMAQKLGSDRVNFIKGHIQDLALDLTALDSYLKQNPIYDAQSVMRLRTWEQQQRHQSPLIADHSIDLVVSNCVLNLVDDSEKQQMIKEIFRVTKAGGRVAISDIISDEKIPEHLKQDPHLWSGCLSGALQEHDFLQAFVDAGFVAVTYDKWETEPWKVLEGIEFRSVTITAIKPHPESCIDKGHAVIYRGAYSKVYDDDGYVYLRGQRMAVCERHFNLLTSGAYGDDFIGITPIQEHSAITDTCQIGALRPVTDTKGRSHQPSNGCNKTSCC